MALYYSYPFATMLFSLQDVGEEAFKFRQVKESTAILAALLGCTQAKCNANAHFTQHQKCQPYVNARGKVKESPMSVGFINIKNHRAQSCLPAATKNMQLKVNWFTLKSKNSVL